MIEAAVFGILQGILEWLPVSSQGNLVLVMIGLFGMLPSLALKYAIFLHSGTLMAALIYFRKDVAGILRGLGTYRPGFSEGNRLVTFLIASTVLTVLVGLPIFLFLASSPFAGELFIALVGIALIATGILQKYSGSGKLKSENSLGWKDSLLLGIVQGLSIIPGISRSGITVSSFLIRGYRPDEALRLSFIMSIPVILVAQVGLSLLDGMPQLGIDKAFAGLLCSLVFGLLFIHVLMKTAGRVKFWLFCIVIGIVALVPMAFYI
jgi:undecaprenyl-diphosphatase